MKEKAGKWWEKTRTSHSINKKKWQGNILPPHNPSCSLPEESPLWQTQGEWRLYSAANLKTEHLRKAIKTNVKKKKQLSLLAVEWRDLETEPAIVAVHGHDGAVVEVGDQPAGHLAPGLMHQVTSLCEEVLTLPGWRHQARLTEKQRERSELAEGLGKT